MVLITVLRLSLEIGIHHLKDGAQSLFDSDREAANFERRGFLRDAESDPVRHAANAVILLCGALSHGLTNLT